LSSRAVAAFPFAQIVEPSDFDLDAISGSPSGASADGSRIRAPQRSAP
jgi:hypothetical protein